MENTRYKKVQDTFIANNCKLLTTEQEYVEMNYKKLPKYKYIASCGHEHIVFYNVFISRKTGIICPSCTTVKNSIIAKEKVSNNKLLCIVQELDAINYVSQLISEHFITVKAFDGCKSDLMVKPKNSNENKWLGIQVKSRLLNTNGYSFATLKKDYSICMILCICLEDKRMWGFTQENIQGLIKLSIGLNKSKYDKYELTENTIIEALNKNYELLKNDFDILNIPTNIYQQREQEFRKYREGVLDYIQFENNNMEGLVYDFKIGNKKIQEKVCAYSKADNKRYLFNLCKNNGLINKKHNQIQYDKGDNDIYWLNCADKTYFFVIPETILIEHEFIGNEKTKQFFKVTPSKLHKKNMWLKPYLFNYTDIDKDRLLQILE
jgi:hypothetical protein